MASVLDNATVKEHGFPLTTGPGRLLLQIVSNCPVCGAPIYGLKVVLDGELPIVRHSCDCRDKSFTDRMLTK